MIVFRNAFFFAEDFFGAADFFADFLAVDFLEVGRFFDSFLASFDFLPALFLVDFFFLLFLLAIRAV